MSNKWRAAAVLICSAMTCHGQGSTSFDAARAFGARPSVSDLQLSPDGTRVVYIAPAKGQGSIAYTMSLAKGAVPKPALSADGTPSRLGSCRWVSNDRIVCVIYAALRDPRLGVIKLTRTVAVDADGKNLRILSTLPHEYSRGWELGGGSVIDWLPDEGGAVLMTRVYLPDDRVGSHLGSSREGLGVDWIDTRTLSVKRVEPPRPEATSYLTDGRGTVRIMGVRQTRAERDSGIITFLYRLAGSREWHTLSDYNIMDQSGFYPQAVDPERNVAYGYKKKDGRVAVYSVALDEALHEELVLPAYLTLPAGKEDAKNLPAIVLPHGGPSSRDEWGFDWLPQFFAARRFAVVQPNFRGSSGAVSWWTRWERERSAVERHGRAVTLRRCQLRAGHVGRSASLSRRLGRARPDASQE